ncbi:MAG TPA: NAD(P)H-dependent oxidoreductase, partial [Trueperaceae bacterium]|nr:NAD(P)H-dependent oxidoreductase [Trueperaceae bacterium]
PKGENSFAGKPTLVSGTSPGNISTAVAQQHLRVMLGYLDAPALGQPEVFISFQPEDLIDDDGNVSVKSTEKFLKDVMSEFEQWVEVVNSGAAEAARVDAA